MASSYVLQTRSIQFGQVVVAYVRWVSSPVVPAFCGRSRQSRRRCGELISTSLHRQPPFHSSNLDVIATMVPSSRHEDGDVEVAVEELIFSCSICQATVSDVYSTSESNKGFHSGSGDEDCIVAKLWIAECSHIICSKHLDGGGMFRFAASR